MEFLQLFGLPLCWRTNAQITKQSFEKIHGRWVKQQPVTWKLYIKQKKVTVRHTPVLPTSHITYIFRIENFKTSPLFFFPSLHKCLSSPGWGTSAPAAAGTLIHAPHSSWAQTQHMSLRAHLVWQLVDKHFWILWKPTGECCLSFPYE